MHLANTIISYIAPYLSLTKKEAKQYLIKLDSKKSTLERESLNHPLYIGKISQKVSVA